MNTGGPVPVSVSDRLDDLPVAAVFDRLGGALRDPGARVVLVAPPGAGKTTAVPLWLARFLRPATRIVMTEPRRVAARAAAVRMAELASETVGRTIGYRTRDETRVSRDTRIEVLTEGVLTQMLQGDPGLEAIDTVILDEFHERSVESDLNLAFTLDVAANLRPDLRIVVMSATIEATAVAALIGAEVVEASYRPHPVTIEYAQAPGFDRPFSAAVVAERIRHARQHCDGSILAFVPGVREIGDVCREIPELAPLVLHGGLSLNDQARVLNAPAGGGPRVIVATSIAETSVTVPDVRAVVDSGWARVPRYDARRGMGGLTTVRVSAASADQRAGRAGRVAPGRCWRLWTETEHARLEPRPEPAIHQSDLTPLALQLLRWGHPTGDALIWLDRPDSDRLAAARRLLHELGLTDDQGRLSDHGARCAALPLHPRLAHAVARGADTGLGATACAVAAELAEGRPGAGQSADMTARAPAESRLASRLRRLVEVDNPSPIEIDRVGEVIALAYPDRVARRRDGTAARFQLASGAGARVDARGALGSSLWIAIAELDRASGQPDAIVRRAAPISEATVLAALGPLITTSVTSEWDDRSHDAVVARVTRLGAIVISTTPIDDAEAAHKALLGGLRREGLGLLPAWQEAATLRARIAYLRHAHGTRWPDVSEAALLERLDEFIGPFLVGARRRADLERVPVTAALRALLTADQRRDLDKQAPEQLRLANGRSAPVDYTGARPQISLRLQALFGVDSTPLLPDGTPVVVEILSPAHRPVQVTADLAGFWKGSYREVRKQLRGRYPKHAWPEDPNPAQAPALPRAAERNR